jgi:hypothetical protein
VAMKSALTRYWFEFDRSTDSARLIPSAGVTAWSESDARALLSDRLFSDLEMPEIVKVIPDVDVSELDHNHVRRNMEPPNARGIWYPRGHQ